MTNAAVTATASSGTNEEGDLEKRDLDKAEPILRFGFGPAADKPLYGLRGEICFLVGAG